MSALTIRQWRLARELSQEQMANLLDIHVNTYISWEKNPGKIPMGKAVEICKILKVSPNDIIFYSETLQNAESEVV